MADAIVISGVTKHYRRRPRPAVDNLSLTVPSGRVTGLLGPNGAGKTTLIKLICGVIPPTSGTLRVLGLDPGCDGVALKRRLGVVHQGHTFDMFLSGLDNLQVAAALQNLRWSALRPWVDELLAAFQLTEITTPPIFTLSGGEQRRFQVVRALLKRPELLILDEPSAGLDISGRLTVWRFLRRVQAESQATVLWTSHYVEELERHCDQIAIIDGGQVVRYDGPSALVREFGRPRVVLRFLAPPSVPTVLDSIASLGLHAEVTAETVEVWGPAVEARLPEVLSTLQPVAQPSDAHIVPATLEDAYLALVEHPPSSTKDDGSNG